MNNGFVFPQELDDQLELDPNKAKRQLFTTQPRGKKLRPFVSEFQAYKSVLFPLNNEQSIQSFMQTLPKGREFVIVLSLMGVYCGMTIQPTNLA